MTSLSTISPARSLHERSALQAVFFDLDGTLDIDPSEDTAAWGADGEAHGPADIVHWLGSWTV